MRNFLFMMNSDSHYFESRFKKMWSQTEMLEAKPSWGRFAFWGQSKESAWGAWTRIAWKEGWRKMGGRECERVNWRSSGASLPGASGSLALRGRRTETCRSKKGRKLTARSSNVLQLGGMSKKWGETHGGCRQLRGKCRPCFCSLQCTFGFNLILPWLTWVGLLFNLKRISFVERMRIKESSNRNYSI